jgi:serine/threonine-protein phosphatase 4 catalytic subunit
MDDYGFYGEIDGYIEKLKKCEYLPEENVKLLCDKAAELLSQEENVLYLNSPITVIKDII